MGRVQTHVRNKLVAGALAAIPVALTIFILWYVDSAARVLREMGFEAMREYTEPKATWINIDAQLPAYYPRG